MSLFLLGYHRITEGPSANLHHLPHHQFQEQMHHLQRAGYLVVSWRDFTAHAGSEPERTRLRVGVTFDDGNDSDLPSARFLHSLGYDALFFIATEYLGRSGYLDCNDVLQLHRLGMGIGSHAHHHVHLVPLGDAQVDAELRQSKRILEDIVQAPVRHLSFPGGSYNSRVVNIARGVGYEYLFTSDWGVNTQRHCRARVFRKTALLNDLDLEQFDALLRLRNYYTRQVGFRVKELAKKTLGANGYVKLRRALRSLVR
jgi:peptidoglycan/xylan/chitin deacetylase (PgdA/CDA1 family)